MITCSRCGKDNQDHYKFCLGCGAKLEAAAPKPKPAVVAPMTPVAQPVAPLPAQMAVQPDASDRPPTPLGTAKTAAPPDPTSFAKPAVAATPPSEAAKRATNVAVASPISRPSVVAVAPVVTAPAAVAAPAPVAKAVPVAAPQIARAPAPVAAPAPVHHRVPTPAVTPMGGIAAPPSAAVAAVAPASADPGTVICPGCGKRVVANFAFCGSCGYKIKAPGAAAPVAAPAVSAIPKTMFMAPTPVKAAPRGHLTLIRPDGTEGGMHPLQEGDNLIGRGQGSLFDADPYLSPRHAEFMLTEDTLVVRDLKSLNGVFVKIAQEERLESGDIFRIGQELLRFDVIAPPSPMEDGTEIIGTPNPGYWGRISVIVGRDVDGPAFPLYDESIVLGRERGDILFPEDGYVSGTHTQITLRDGAVYLSDLGSSNGTFFRICSARTIASGSLLLMGQQLFRAAYR